MGDSIASSIENIFVPALEAKAATRAIATAAALAASTSTHHIYHWAGRGATVAAAQQKQQRKPAQITCATDYRGAGMWNQG